VSAFLLEGTDFGGANQYVDGLYGTLQEVVTFTSIPGNFGGPPCNPTAPGCFSLSSYLGLIK